MDEGSRLHSSGLIVAAINQSVAPNIQMEPANRTRRSLSPQSASHREKKNWEENNARALALHLVSFPPHIHIHILRYSEVNFLPFYTIPQCLARVKGPLRDIFMMALANEFRRGDDDANDHIDSDTPRSGVATPQPDPSDKRLPGIMQYFGQVGLGSSTNSNPKPKPSSSPSSTCNINSDAGSHSGPLASPSLAVRSNPENPLPSCAPENMSGDAAHLAVGPDSINETAGECNTEDAPHLSQEERAEPPQASGQSEENGFHTYPTPPVSHSPSMHKSNLSHSASEEEAAPARRATTSSFSAHKKSISESIPSHARRASLLPLSSIVTASNVLASHFSNPSDHCPAITPSTPVHSRLDAPFHESPSYDRLKKLTDDVSCTKSIPPTPTRALSNQTAKSDTSGGSEPAAAAAAADSNANGNGQNGKANIGEALPIQTSAGVSGAPVAAPKGKLTVKITEARGLRRSRDPYVVAVFQRNELVSKGPLHEDRDENEEVTSNPMMGGIPIMRSGSDSGRPMAIPMKSRQSSNTSLSEYRDFKSKGRRSFTNPKWDTEAVL